MNKVFLSLIVTVGMSLVLANASFAASHKHHAKHHHHHHHVAKH